MEIWDTVTGLLPVIAPFIPTNVLAIVGAVAMAGTALSKPESQVQTKSGWVFQTVLKYLGGNFGKSSNK